MLGFPNMADVTIGTREIHHKKTSNKKKKIILGDKESVGIDNIMWL